MLLKGTPESWITVDNTKCSSAAGRLFHTTGPQTENARFLN